MKRPLKEAFAEEWWGLCARNWVKTAERLTDGDWVEIMFDVNARAKLPGSAGAVMSDGLSDSAIMQAEGSGSVLNPRACMEL